VVLLVGANIGLKNGHPDRCSYPRPFPEGFDACPAFQATSFIAADSRNKPLGTWRTCRHLGTGNDVENRGRFYPRCALGDQGQRLQWVAQVSPAKLDVVRAKIAELQAMETELAGALRQCRTALRQPSKHRDSCPVLQAITKPRPQRKKA